MSLVIKKPLRYNNIGTIYSNTGPRGYLLGRLTDPVKRTAYQLVPSWSATGLWDCSFEDSGIYQRFDHFKKRFPHIFKFGKSYLSTSLFVRDCGSMSSLRISARGWKKNIYAYMRRTRSPQKRENREEKRDANEQLRYRHLPFKFSLIGYPFVDGINCSTLS